MYRPDNREPSTVWFYFNEAFEQDDFPTVGWALGSDWGYGSPAPRDSAHYREMAEARMTALYGPHPT